MNLSWKLLFVFTCKEGYCLLNVLIDVRVKWELVIIVKLTLVFLLDKISNVVLSA